MTDAILKGLVQNNLESGQPDGGSLVLPAFGRHSEQLVDLIHGQYFYPTLRGKGFYFDVTGVTVPVVAATLVSVFSLYNPPQSGVLAELVDVDINQVLATTVVNTFGWYFTAGSGAQGSTFTTPGTARARRVGDTASNRVTPYSALTHVGTPVRCDTIGGHGATANATSSGIHKEYNGKLLVPPGVVISLATSTAAGTASGLGLAVSWLEWPFLT